MDPGPRLVARPGMTSRRPTIKKACRHLRRQAILARSRSCGRYATQRLLSLDGIGV